jgi:hypothetical protein
MPSQTVMDFGTSSSKTSPDGSATRTMPSAVSWEDLSAQTMPCLTLEAEAGPVRLWAGQPLYIKRTGIRKIKGDDGGCFAATLNAVRQFGGVLEHPCGSHAWAHFGLNKPPREGGWIVADFHGGWTCCVEQGRYGHYARKPTWLYAVGCELPELDWGIGESRLDPSVIERMGLARAKRLGEVGSRGGGTDSSPRIGTPPRIPRLAYQHRPICGHE